MHRRRRPTWAKSAARRILPPSPSGRTRLACRTKRSRHLIATGRILQVSSHSFYFQSEKGAFNGALVADRFPFSRARKLKNRICFIYKSKGIPEAFRFALERLTRLAGDPENGTVTNSRLLRAIGNSVALSCKANRAAKKNRPEPANWINHANAFHYCFE